MFSKRLRVLFTVILFLFISCSIFVVKTINDADLSKIISVGYQEKTLKRLNFEEGALLKRDEFVFFKANTEDERFTSVFNKKFVNPSKSQLSIKENFSLASLKKNDCDFNRCLQYKIAFFNIPIILSKGLIGIEDFRFLDHIGVDYISIIRAIIADIRAGSLVQGGSTLTQQLVKNIYFTNEKAFSRKIKEAILAIYIEFKFDKSQILEAYFNEVFWGSIGGIRIKGVNTAAVLYFNKPISELNPYESSILVSMLKGPNYYHPIKRTDRLKKRANFIYAKLKTLDLFNKNINYKWSDEVWAKWVNKLNANAEKYLYEAVYLTSTKIKDEPELNEYRYFKTASASKVLLVKLREVEKNLAVKISFGNKESTTSYYSKFERKLERAINEERHSVGSTLKPILYQIYLDHGYLITDEVSTDKVTLDLVSGKWTPAESHTPSAELFPLSQALQESLNNPVIRLARDIGFEKVEKDLDSKIPHLKKPLSEYPAQLLGAVELSIQELYSAYSTFLAEQCGKGANIYKALSEPSITTIRRQLHPLMKNQNFFGKTGTSNNGFDNLFVGFDGHDLFTIWVGYEGNRSNKKSLRIYGSTTAFRLYQEIVLFSGQRIASLNCEE